MTTDSRGDPSPTGIHRANHALFQEHVGGHTDYDVQGGRQGGQLRPRGQWERFYEAELEKAEECREEQVVGYALRLFLEG